MLLVAPIKNEIRRELTNEDKKGLIDSNLLARVKIDRSSIPAVTHVDYSARVQSVTEERNGRYYRLIREFRNLFKSPILVNTSFNVRGEPIVCTPQDAYRCFVSTDMDVLVLENFVLLNTNNLMNPLKKKKNILVALTSIKNNYEYTKTVKSS